MFQPQMPVEEPITPTYATEKEAQSPSKSEPELPKYVVVSATPNCVPVGTKEPLLSHPKPRGSTHHGR